jgi:RNA recognition motif-containing protein
MQRAFTAQHHHQQRLHPPPPPNTNTTARQEEYFARLAASATLYIGNLSFYTTEDQVSCLVLTGRGTRSLTTSSLARMQPAPSCMAPAHPRPHPHPPNPTPPKVYALFSRVGHVQRVIMGLDSQRKTPCGFCFVIYDRRQVRGASWVGINAPRVPPPREP